METEKSKLENDIEYKQGKRRARMTRKTKKKKANRDNKIKYKKMQEEIQTRKNIRESRRINTIVHKETIKR